MELGAELGIEPTTARSTRKRILQTYTDVYTDPNPAYSSKHVLWWLLFVLLTRVTLAPLTLVIVADVTQTPLTRVTSPAADHQRPLHRRPCDLASLSGADCLQTSHQKAAAKAR